MMSVLSHVFNLSMMDSSVVKLRMVLGLTLQLMGSGLDDSSVLTLM